MQKINWSIINFVLIIVLGVALGFGGYSIIQKLNTPKVIQPVLVQEDNNNYRGQVEYIEGEVEKRKSVEHGWLTVQKGQFLDKGDEIRTLNSSRAIVTFEDGSILRLNENTNTKILSTKDNINIVLNKGEVFNRVSKSETRKYSVQSGDFKIIALGTEFGVEKKNQTEAKVLVIESEVEVQDKKGNKIEKIETGKKAELKKEKVVKTKITSSDTQTEFIAWNIKENQVKEKQKLQDNKKEEKKKENETEKKENKDEQKKAVEKVAKKVVKKPTQPKILSKVSLWGKKTKEGVKLTWDVKGVDVSHGFKVVKSTGKNPVYPGNDYRYFSDSNKRSYEWKINDGKGYYFRVCAYLGNGKCGLYSRNVYVKVPMKNIENNNDGKVISISLTGTTGNGYVDLKWDVNGYSSKGFKLVRSTSINPVYPGNEYKYFSDSSKKSYKWNHGLKNGQKYYFRVCEYLGGKCGVYSNNVSFVVKNNEEEDDNYATKISLTASRENNGVNLKWNVNNGKTPKGFKVVRSTSINPVYPGNDYKYFSDSNKRSYEWNEGFKSGQKYYFRVCVYKGNGVCGTYSNNSSLEF